MYCSVNLVVFNAKLNVLKKLISFFLKNIIKVQQIENKTLHTLLASKCSAVEGERHNTRRENRRVIKSLILRKIFVDEKSTSLVFNIHDHSFLKLFFIVIWLCDLGWHFIL